MHAFLAGDADVLVSTTIIESGIDIPQANTLVVERADMLGLSQLYQIRGRVGRSDLTAHAYLFYPDATELTPEARARLATLADHTELGAGFQIAMRDLEIRGAGDLLGAEQSGHVAALGFELYVEMLNEAVAELSGQARAAVRPGPGRRARRRVHSRLVHRLGGAQDRPSPPSRARRARRRAARAPRRRRGPLRPAARARRQPLPDPGGEAEGGADRRRLPRLPGRPRHRRAARAGLGRAPGAPHRAATRSSTSRRSARRASAPTISRRRWGSPML